jgi:hypothetical protein
MNPKRGNTLDIRKHAELIPEDQLVLENLKALQDCSSPDQKLLPCQRDNIAHTFNNALVAMAFMVKDEKERAERILNFYADAMNAANMSPDLQNFFYKGEPRGFFQHMLLNDEQGIPAYHTAGFTDRWMGDMAWLAIAYKYYEKKYGFENKPQYEKIAVALKELLKSFYKDDPQGGGYVQHGWRWGALDIRMAIEKAMNEGPSVSDFIPRYRIEGPKNKSFKIDQLCAKAKNDDHLHETAFQGHFEGNIDCYAVFKLYGENETASQIKIWLDREIQKAEDNNDYIFLDWISWRALAFGKENPGLYQKLVQLDNDQRYRKTVVIKNQTATGFYHGPEPVDNIWMDGTGHIICAFYAAGEIEKGNFYANQLDKFIIEQDIHGKITHSIPYTANNAGGYPWVRLNTGFVSVNAWYIFAKNQFNPMDF